jgi:hypothetical protein
MDFEPYLEDSCRISRRVPNEADLMCNALSDYDSEAYKYCEPIFLKFDNKFKREMNIMYEKVRRPQVNHDAKRTLEFTEESESEDEPEVITMVNSRRPGDRAKSRKVRRSRGIPPPPPPDESEDDAKFDLLSGASAPPPPLYPSLETNLPSPPDHNSTPATATASAPTPGVDLKEPSTSSAPAPDDLKEPVTSSAPAPFDFPMDGFMGSGTAPGTGAVISSEKIVAMLTFWVDEVKNFSPYAPFLGKRKEYCQKLSDNLKIKLAKKLDIDDDDFMDIYGKYDLGQVQSGPPPEAVGTDGCDVKCWPNCTYEEDLYASFRVEFGRWHPEEVLAHYDTPAFRAEKICAISRFYAFEGKNLRKKYKWPKAAQWCLQFINNLQNGLVEIMHRTIPEAFWVPIVISKD